MSTIRVDNFGPSAGGTTYSARGIAKTWINFNGTGTIAIRDSLNVSSIDDDGTGDYGVNYSVSMASSNYKITTGASSAAAVCVIRLDTVSTGSIDIRAFDSSSSVNDAQQVNLDISGDLT